jgi:hypothetical protein
MYTKVIKAVKSPDTGAYTFEEKVINKDEASRIFKRLIVNL